MNGVQNREDHIMEKPFPGCLGRMVNLFDITAGVTGNKLLTDKPHRDASTLSRSRSDVSRMSGPPYADQSEDKKVHQSTPMKMLIDEEMTREVHVKHNSPTVVARLMGLDTFPGVPPISTVFRCNSSYYSGRYSHVDTPSRCWHHSDDLEEKQTILGYSSQCAKLDNCSDIHDTGKQLPRSSKAINNSAKKARSSNDVNKKKMDLVRQKFDEAKHLSTNDKLRQSKEFEDALEVLSSNQDLLLEILQESNPRFYQNLFDLKSTAHPVTKQITVLRPTKMVENGTIARTGKTHFQHMHKRDCANSTVTWNKNDLPISPTSQKLDEQHIQPTRIVVLKPSPNRTSDLRAVASTFPPSPGTLPPEDIFEELEDGRIIEPQKVAQEITQVMHENLVDHGPNETPRSSMFSNGYNGDESSFEKSEIEYPVRNLSDLEVTFPSPRHAWDYVNRCGSPYSSSPFSRASCSPDSSVCREAKKQLSERWTLVASKGSSQEQKLGRKSSSTLGEMLALSDLKKPIVSENGRTSKDQGSGESTSCSSSNVNEGGSPKSLQRSKSLLMSSEMYGNRLNVQVSGHEAGEAQVSKELTKAGSRKSSLRGKVSSLLFPRNKKSNNENASVSQTNNESQLVMESPASAANFPLINSNEAHIGSVENGPEESSIVSGQNPPDMNHPKGIISHQPGLSVSPVTKVSSQNQDQPSPVSVLDPPFEEDENATMDSLIKPHHLGPSILQKSSLIYKSPPIGSIARTLSWDSSHADVTTQYPISPSTVPMDIREEEEDLLSCVLDLLSLAGLDEQMLSDSIFSRWHSPDSVLDPSLRDKFAARNAKVPLQEAKRRQKRSKQKLIFDCVNATLEKISGYGSEKHPASMTYCGGVCIPPQGTTPILVDLIVERMKELLSCERSCMLENIDGESHCLVVETAIREEVIGRGWIDLMRLEMDNFGTEMEGKLLEELVNEAVDDLIHTVR